jgi:hypothetical protein
MAQVMVVVGASGLACWLAAALLLPRRTRAVEPSIAEPEPELRNPTREEDRVRPAVTATGERIWVEPDQLIWHEIVAWPERKSTVAGPKQLRWPA